MISRGQISFQVSKSPRRRTNGKKEVKKRRMLSQVKSRYKVYPALRFGALSKCRKVGAANWGNSKKAAEGGVVSAIDNPKRPQEEILKDGGFIAAGFVPAMQEKKRQVTRIF